MLAPPQLKTKTGQTHSGGKVFPLQNRKRKWARFPPVLHQFTHRFQRMEDRGRRSGTSHHPQAGAAQAASPTPAAERKAPRISEPTPRPQLHGTGCAAGQMALGPEPTRQTSAPRRPPCRCSPWAQPSRGTPRTPLLPAPGDTCLLWGPASCRGAPTSLTLLLPVPQGPEHRGLRGAGNKAEGRGSIRLPARPPEGCLCLSGNRLCESLVQEGLALRG